MIISLADSTQSSAVPESNALADATESIDRTLTVTRAFAAPRNDVFKCFSDKNRFARWMAPEGVQVVDCQLNAKKGGNYRAVMREPDDHTHVITGEFREIVPNERLVFSWSKGDEEDPGLPTIVTLDFRDHNGGTEITLTQSVFDTLQSRDEHAKYWEGSFDCLNNFLAC